MADTKNDPYIILESGRGFESLCLRDKLLSDSREIFLLEEVDAQSCGSLITQLMYLNRIEPCREITLYINSP